MYNTIADRLFLSPNRQPKRISVSSFPRSLGIVETLGETVAGLVVRGNSHRVVEEVMGHTGCVNTLDWSESGRLASAGDCTKICIWKAGAAPIRSNESSERAPISRFGLFDTIATGHRANIFNIKWAPNSDSKLFTCAGDHEVRVFDLAASTNGGTIVSTSADRVKKIAAEQNEDVFLTASEDGTVRWDILLESESRLQLSDLG